MSDFPPIPVDELLAQASCCGAGCENCPYVPRQLGGETSLDTKWVVYAAAHPDQTYTQYAAQKNVK